MRWRTRKRSSSKASWFEGKTKTMRLPRRRRARTGRPSTELMGGMAVRRSSAVCISVAAIDIPNSPAIYILTDSIAGAKLAEGDKPAGYLISHEGMAVHTAYWRKMRAFVEVSTGEKYYSNYPDKERSSACLGAVAVYHTT